MMRPMRDFFLKLAERLRKNKGIVLLFSFVFSIGFFARFYQLEGYFTNTDDLGILLGVLDGKKMQDPLHLSRALTNAPFEYLFTYFLVSPDMNYREFLFWGRLPSCVAGCLALVMLWAFYRVYDKKNWHKAFLAIVLVACSWDNIAYAKQMHSYAIGVLGVVILFFLLALHYHALSFNLRSACMTSVVIAVTCSMQYQMFLFIPAFYLSLFLFYFPDSENKALALRNFLFSGILCLILLWPIWHFFLEKRFYDFYQGTQWALGASGEYGLPGKNFPSGLWAQVKYVLWFYFHNLFVIIEAKTGFFPETHPLFKFFAIGLFVSFLFGVVNFVLSPEKKTRFLGLFIGLAILTWWGMVPLKNLPYGPSRHTLILLPFLAVTTAEGIEGLSRLLGRFTGKEMPVFMQRQIWMGLGMLVIVFFLAYYGQFLKERKNPIIEEEIVDVLETYDVDELFFDQRTFQMQFMKRVAALRQKIQNKNSPDFRTFAIITRYPVPSLRAMCENCLWVYGKALKDDKLKLPSCSDLYVVYEKKFESEAMEGFSRKIKSDMFTNRFYFFVLSVDPEKTKLASKFNSKV